MTKRDDTVRSAGGFFAVLRPAVAWISDFACNKPTSPDGRPQRVAAIRCDEVYRHRAISSACMV